MTRSRGRCQGGPWHGAEERSWYGAVRSRQRSKPHPPESEGACRSSSRITDQCCGEDMNKDSYKEYGTADSYSCSGEYAP